MKNSRVQPKGRSNISHLLRSLKINEGLRILVEEAMVPFDYAINACTCNPAQCIGVSERKGTIGVGYDGDLVVLDTDYTVIQTFCKGKKQIRC